MMWGSELKDRSRTSCQPVGTATGLDRSQNCKRPHKTAEDRSSSVRSSLLQFSRMERPVSVSVQAPEVKKPDRTGLPSTTLFNKPHRLDDNIQGNNDDHR